MEFSSGYSVQSFQGELQACSHQGLGQNDNSNIPSSPLHASACVRTMSIIELRCSIFELVDLDSFTRKKTFLALALTCVSFKETALDFLWQRLDSFSPLIRCLPPRWKLSNGGLTFQRATTSEDWSIFDKYNHRVHSLTLVDHAISTKVWAIITRPPFSTPLLPNLISLTWHSSGVTTFSSIRMFVTQKLATLNIYVPRRDAPDVSTQSILMSIPILCPSVSHFHFHSGMGPDPSIALQSWFHLSSVRTGSTGISDAAILHLASLPSLRELDFELHLPTIPEATKIILQHPTFLPFPALQELSITCYSLASLDAIFETLSIAPKRLFFIIKVKMSYLPDLPASMLCISNACEHNALEHLKVHIIDSEGQSGDPIGVSPVFRPLCSFHNLRKFDFHSKYNVNLDGATFLQMAKAWPLLEELTIHEGGYVVRSYVTADSFVGLLQYCPRLTSVDINVNWSGVDQRNISLDIPYQGFIHGNLSRARFCNSRIHYATGVAAFLSAIAPRLKIVSGWECIHRGSYYKSVKYTNRWRTVHRLIKSFSVIREQERRMIVKAGEIIGGDIRVGGGDSETRKDDGMENDYSDYISTDSEEPEDEEDEE